MQLSYKAKIKLLKITLIGIMLLVVLSFLVIPIIYLKIRTKGYLFASNILAGLLKNDIKPPVISGTTQQGGAYYLSAQKITNNFLDFNIKDSPIIEVFQPTLVYTTNKNGLIFFISSQSAIINPQTHVINIPGTININSNQGYGGTLQNFLINIKEDYGESNKPVSGYFSNKILNAKGIKIQQGGAIVTFKGDVEIFTK